MLNENEMAEYAFYINVGENMSDVMHGWAAANGIAFKNRIL